MRVHVVDGTYELFRHFYALPPRIDASGTEVAATSGVVASLLGLLEDGATHVGVATDHVIESFRNDLWPGYKTGEGLDPALVGQFTILEEALEALGVAVWPMIDLEADDALASAASVASSDERVDQVVICTPDKDLAQCVEGARVVLLDRRRRIISDADAVSARYGVPPCAIPDWLALVGDAADGYPGLPGWGARSASAVLARYGRLEAIPPRGWDVAVRGAERLARTLDEGRDRALLFRTLATLRRDAPVGAVDDWLWRGPTPRFAAVCERLGAADLPARAAALAR